MSKKKITLQILLITKISKMKKLTCFVIFSLFMVMAYAQTKKDGTPDMRFKVNKEMYGTTPTYSQPSYTSPKVESREVDYTPPTRNYDNGGEYKLQKGYLKSNGTYVSPHLKTSPDNFKWNNKNPR